MLSSTHAHLSQSIANFIRMRGEGLEGTEWKLRFECGLVTGNLLNALHVASFIFRKKPHQVILTITTVCPFYADRLESLINMPKVTWLV